MHKVPPPHMFNEAPRDTLTLPWVCVAASGLCHTSGFLAAALTGKEYFFLCHTLSNPSLTLLQLRHTEPRKARTVVGPAQSGLKSASKHNVGRGVGKEPCPLSLTKTCKAQFFSLIAVPSFLCHLFSSMP